MSKRIQAVAVALALLAAGSWALAQQNAPLPAENVPAGPAFQPDVPLPRGPLPPPAVNVVKAPAAPRAPQGFPGRYAVALSGERGLLLDTATGKTWDLGRSADGRAAWLPTRRLESEKDVQQWLDQQRQRGAARLELQRAKDRLAAEVARAQQERQQADALQAKLRDKLRLLEDRLRELQAQKDQARAEQEQVLRALRDQLNPPDRKKDK
jgi:hypothetical protein